MITSSMRGSPLPTSRNSRYPSAPRPHPPSPAKKRHRSQRLSQNCVLVPTATQFPNPLESLVPLLDREERGREARATHHLVVRHIQVDKRFPVGVVLPLGILVQLMHLFVARIIIRFVLSRSWAGGSAGGWRGGKQSRLTSWNQGSSWSSGGPFAISSAMSAYLGASNSKVSSRCTILQEVQHSLLPSSSQLHGVGVTGAEGLQVSPVFSPPGQSRTESTHCSLPECSDCNPRLGLGPLLRVAVSGRLSPLVLFPTPTFVSTPTQKFDFLILSV